MPNNISKTNMHYMKLALKLAARGAGWVSPNPMVGAVVVKDGRLVGRGWHRRVGAAHAEVEALRQAGDAARNADLYVTLEPCNHLGRTPPCTQAILGAGVARLIIATQDPNPQVTGGGAEYLRSRGVVVETGLLAAAARRLNEAWFHWVNTGRPWVIAKAACSLDGKIATAGGESQWLTGEAARAFGHRLRHQVDAILVGIDTVLADDPLLTTRLPDNHPKNDKRKTKKPGKDPIRLVLDSKLRIPLTAKLLHLDSPAPTWVACTDASPPQKVRKLERLGAEVLRLPQDSGRVSLPDLLKLLGARQIQSLLVEGGAEVLGSFFDQNLINMFHFFYAPKILGGRNAPGVLGGRGVHFLKDAHPAQNLELRCLGPDLLISGHLLQPSKTI